MEINYKSEIKAFILFNAIYKRKCDFLRKMRFSSKYEILSKVHEKQT